MKVKSVPRQVDKESRGPQGERGLEFSRRKKGQTFFLSPDSLGLYNNNEVMSLLFNMLSRLTNEQNFPKQFGKV